VLLNVGDGSVRYKNAKLSRRVRGNDIVMVENRDNERVSFYSPDVKAIVDCRLTACGVGSMSVMS